MKKIFSISTPRLSLVLAITLLVILSAWYYLLYIPGNEKDLYEQHFRWLQKTDKNIRDKIEATDSLLTNLARGHITSGMALSQDEKNISTNSGGGIIAIDTLIDTAKARNIVKEKNTGYASPKFSVGTNDDTSQLVVTVVYPINKSDRLLKISLRYNFTQFLAPLLQAGLFEHYVVFYKGRYVYEDFHSGLGYAVNMEDSLLKTGKWLTGASILDQKVGGVPYKLFLQPVNFFGSNRLIIAAMHTQQKFDAEKKQLPPNTALLGIIVSFGIFLLLPWIRLYCLGKYDRLSLGDATESLIVTKLIISLLALFFIKYSLPKETPEGNKPETVLAKTISTAFTSAIDSAFFCLGKLDSLQNISSSFTDKNGIGTGKVASITKGDTLYDALKHLYAQFQFTEVNWMDDEGSVVCNWTTAACNAAKGNYKDRDYFRMARQHNTINATNKANGGFTLEPVISRTNNDFKTVICKPSVLKQKNKTSAKYIVMDWSLKSLDSVILPAGYCFAIIDAQGDVKYHSNQTRNLNENLAEEFSSKKELQEALQGRYEEDFNTIYYKENYAAKVRPIKDYPYFMVVMNNQGLPNSIEIETFTFSWGMLLLFLLNVLTDLFILIRASSRRSLFKKQALVTSWLWPRKSSRYEYFAAGFGHIIVIIFLIAGFVILHYLCYFFLLFCSVPILTIYFNCLFISKYKMAHEKIYRSLKERCIIWSTGYLLLINSIAILVLDSEVWAFLLFEFAILLALALIFYFLFTYGKEIMQRIKDPIPARRYLHAYMFMVLTRLIITSCIPVFFFYSASFTFEQNLLARNREFDYVNQLKNKYPEPQKLINAVKNPGQNGIYLDSTWIKKLSVGVVINDTGKNIDSIHEPLSQKTATMFNAFGNLLESVSGNHNDNFYKSASDDSAYIMNNIFDSVLYAKKGNQLLTPLDIIATPDSSLPVFSAGTHIPAAKINHRWLLAESGRPGYEFAAVGLLQGFSGIAFWMRILFCLAVVYFILYDITKRVCSLNTDRYSKPGDPKNACKKLLASGHAVWLTGVLPGELLEVTKEIIQSIRTVNMEQQEADTLFFNDITERPVATPLELTAKNTGTGALQLLLSGIDEKETVWDIAKKKVLNSLSKYVILLHIENQLSNDKITTAKLDCIRELQKKGKTLIIISNMFPLAIQDAFAKSTGGSELKDARGNQLDYSIFSDFPLLIFPLSVNHYPENSPAATEASFTGDTEPESTPDKKKELWKALNEETAHSAFLKRLHNELKPGNFFSGDATPDQLILKIESLSNSFYYSIWQALSADEKFILYDLAEDGLANINNAFAVNLLVSKGLIKIAEGHPSIFNRSFRNFIVNSIGEPAEKEIRNLSGKGNTWSQLQAPLLLLVVAIFLFLGVSQEGIFSNLMGVISGVLAGIPILLKLFAMLGIKGGKDTKDVTAEKSSG